MVSGAAVWSTVQRAEIFSCLPSDARTWDLVDQSDHETQRAYWRGRGGSPFGVATGDVTRVARKLMEHGRPYAAAELLSLQDADAQVSPELIAATLEQVFKTPPTEDPWSASLSHQLPELIDMLMASGAVEDQRVAALEWAFLPVLG